MHRIGKELRKKRIERGWTIEYVADLIGWSPSKVSKIETEVQPIYVDDLLMYMEVLEAERIASFTVHWDPKEPSLLRK